MRKSRNPDPGAIPSRRRTRPCRRRAQAGAPRDSRPAEEAGDARLVELARAGDDRAFAALVARYERKLIRVLARLVRDEELARDLAQETFWKVYNRLDRFDTSRRFGPWLFRVGVNLGARPAPPPRARRRAASIDRPADDGRRAFDLPDPDPRLRAELAQEVQFILERVPVAVPDDPGPAGPGRVLVGGGGGHRRPPRGHGAVAAGQGPRAVPRAMGTPPGGEVDATGGPNHGAIASTVDGCATACRCWPAASWRAPSAARSSGT